MITNSLDAVKQALLRAIAENGVPNKFAPTELYWEHGGPRPMVIGRIVKRSYAGATFQVIEPGIAVYDVTYRNRVFHCVAAVRP